MTERTDAPRRAVPWTGTPARRSFAFADSPHEVTVTPVDPARHRTLVHGWMHQPHVVPWWHLDGSEAEVSAYLERQISLDHLVPWIASVDDRPVAYVETYVAHLDPLARFHPLGEGDRGWHVLVGPADELGSGRPHLVGRAVLRLLFAEPGVARVVCEPDVRNRRMHRFCARLGHEPVAELALPDKQALLLVCGRDEFARRFPHDVTADATGAPA